MQGDLHQAESALANQRSGEQEQQRGGQDGAGGDPGQRHADQQDNTEREYERHKIRP